MRTILDSGVTGGKDKLGADGLLESRKLGRTRTRYVRRNVDCDFLMRGRSSVGLLVRNPSRHTPNLKRGTCCKFIKT